MITDGRPFDTNVFFSGGAGMFIQYHDIVKPVYLFAIAKMLIFKTSFGLPLDIIERMSVFSLIEWYVKRRYKNPLQCLDYKHIIEPDKLDKLLLDELRADNSLYKLSPGLNVRQMLNVYKQHHMTFPIYIYSENEEPYILQDCKQLFPGINIRYLHGDLKEAVSKCDNNFTYILSDIELVKQLSDILIGTYSHILIPKEYRYNYKDNCNTFKYNLLEMAKSHPYIRIGVTTAMDMNQMVVSFNDIMFRGGSKNAAN